MSIKSKKFLIFVRKNYSSIYFFKMRTITLILLSFILNSLQAQYPATEIYVMKYKTKKGKALLSHPLKAIAHKGYNNQPFFVKGSSKIVFVSIPEGDSQTDVYAYDYRNGSIIRVTQTPESEFSPKIYRNKMTAVRIECGPDSIQRLWQFTVSDDWKADKEYVLFSNRKAVGYYDWVNDTEIGIFIVGDKDIHSLHYLNTEESWRDSLIAENIGRSLWKVPGKNALSFVQKTTDNKSLIKTVSFKNGKKEELIPTFPGSEDFVWHPKGYLLTLYEGKLYRYHPRKGGDWQEVANLEGLGLGDFYRMAFHPNGKKIALVKYEGKKP